MTSRTSNQACWKVLDAGTYCKQVTAEHQTANVVYFQKNIHLSRQMVGHPRWVL